jgi:hypothetical protein
VIPVDVALKIAKRRAEERNYELIMPDSPYRQAVVYGLAATHALTGSGWDLDHAREYTSTTLPGAGPLVDLLAQIPVAGAILAQIAGKLRRTTVCLSPAAARDGLSLLATLGHEEGHVGDIARGGLLWCACYGVIGEVRAGGEAPCFGVGMALRHGLGAQNIDDLEAASVRALDAYGLGDDTFLARGIVRSNAASLRLGADPGGVIAEFRAELAREGWEP